jgi:hypothetical protein
MSVIRFDGEQSTPKIERAIVEEQELCQQAKAIGMYQMAAV